MEKIAWWRWQGSPPRGRAPRGPALLTGGAGGATVWHIPAAAGFKILPAVVVAVRVAAVTTGLAVAVASAVGG